MEEQMVNILRSTFESFRVLPTKLDGLRTAENLERLSDIIRAKIYNMGFQVHSGTYIKLYSSIKNLSQVIYSLRIFRTPSLLFNSVKGDTIIRSDSTVNDLVEMLKRTENPVIRSSKPDILVSLQNDPAKLETVVRDVLDHLFSNEKSYTVNTFKISMQKELSNRLSTMSQEKVEVDLSQWKVPYQSRTWIQLAVVITKTITSALLSAAFIQDWGLYDFTRFANRFGLEDLLAKKGRGEMGAFSLVYKYDCIIYTLTAIEALSNLKKDLDLEVSLDRKPVQVKIIDSKIYHAWKFFISAANSILYAFANTVHQDRKFYTGLQIIKVSEILGDLCLKPKVEKFRKV